MNIKLAIASGIALVAASASFADSIDYPHFSDVVPTKSRAEVTTELAAARAEGMSLQVLDGQYPVIVNNSGAQRSRQEVVAELEQFRAEHPTFSSDVDYPGVFQAAPVQQRLAGMSMPSTPR